MNKKKIPLYVTIGICVIAIIVGTIIKINDNHLNDLYKVTINQITYKARKCYLDEVCKEEKTTLSFLVNNGYIEKTVNPKTNEYFKDDCYVTYIDGKTEFYLN